jgi:hypothetical protein
VRLLWPKRIVDQIQAIEEIKKLLLEDTNRKTNFFEALKEELLLLSLEDNNKLRERRTKKES